MTAGSIPANAQRSAKGELMSWTMTHHALKRGVEMALDPDDIREVLEHPTEVKPSRLYGDNCMYRKRGRLVAVVNHETKTVVTLLWNLDLQNGERFDRDDIDITRDWPIQR